MQPGENTAAAVAGNERHIANGHVGLVVELHVELDFESLRALVRV